MLLSEANGDEEIRTLDPLLARQVLSQLSYIPIQSGSHLLSHTVSSAVPSAGQVLTVVFGMGTGVSPVRIATRNIRYAVASAQALRKVVGKLAFLSAFCRLYKWLCRDRGTLFRGARATLHSLSLDT